MNYYISRHPGALDWLRANAPRPAMLIRHLSSLDALGPEDTVIGTLPIHLVAEVCRRGVRYLHLQIDLPAHLRGVELTAEQLTELDAHLVEYFVFRPVSDEAVLQLADQQGE